MGGASPAAAWSPRTGRKYGCREHEGCEHGQEEVGIPDVTSCTWGDQRLHGELPRARWTTTEPEVFEDPQPAIKAETSPPARATSAR